MSWLYDKTLIDISQLQRQLNSELTGRPIRNGQLNRPTS
jgi:hypothetical protein